MFIVCIHVLMCLWTWCALPASLRHFGDLTKTCWKFRTCILCMLSFLIPFSPLLRTNRNSTDNTDNVCMYKYRTKISYTRAGPGHRLGPRRARAVQGEWGWGRGRGGELPRWDAPWWTTGIQGVALKGDLLSMLDAPKEMNNDGIATYVHNLYRCSLIFMYLHECLWLVYDFR